MRHWWLLLISCLSLSLSAAEVTDLYESRIEVESQSREHRQAVLDDALEAVLIKVSGQRDVVRQPAIRSQLGRATNYLTQYGYVSEGNRLYLRTQFDERRIDELLRSADASFWSARRPNILFWVALETERGVQLIGRDGEAALIPAMRQQARQRGLPVAFPLLDLTDRMRVSASDVWGRFDNTVVEASQRYPADGSALVRVQQNEEGAYHAQWTLVIGNVRRNGQTEAGDQEIVGAAIVDGVTDRVAAEYAVSFGEGEAGEFTIRVVNLQTLENVLLVESLFQRLASVEQATLVRYHQGTAEFKLHLIGDVGRAMQTLELDNRLRRVEDPWSATASPVVEYQWLH